MFFFVVVLKYLKKGLKESLTCGGIITSLVFMRQLWIVFVSCFAKQATTELRSKHCSKWQIPIWEVLLDVQSFLVKSSCKHNITRTELASELPLSRVSCHLILGIIDCLVHSGAKVFILDPLLTNRCVSFCLWGGQNAPPKLVRALCGFFLSGFKSRGDDGGK